MRTFRPVGATHHSCETNDYYKTNGEGWMRWYGGGSGWLPVADVDTAKLTILSPVQVVELEKFDAPMAPLVLPEPQHKDPHGVYKVQLTRWQAEDGSLHESYESAINHGVFKELDALMGKHMDRGEIDSDAFIASLLERYTLARKL